MAQLSPLRRRMIEDMTVRNMSPATQRSYMSAVSKFTDILASRPSGSIWKTFALSRFTWSRRPFRGPLSTRSFAPCVLLWRHAGRGGRSRAYPLCARAA